MIKNLKFGIGFAAVVMVLALPFGLLMMGLAKLHDYILSLPKDYEEAKLPKSEQLALRQKREDARWQARKS